jgi:hypothetical protein
MAATPEAKIKQALDRMLKKHGVWFYSPQAGPYGVAGIPDRVCIVRGKFVGIECKADKTKHLTALQERCREKILEAGADYFVVYDRQTMDIVEAYISARTRRHEEAGSQSEEP